MQGFNYRLNQWTVTLVQLTFVVSVVEGNAGKTLHKQTCNVTGVQTHTHTKEMRIDQLIGWNLMSHQHASDYMRRPCKGQGLTWLLLLKPKTGGYKNDMKMPA